MRLLLVLAFFPWHFAWGQEDSQRPRPAYFTPTDRSFACEAPPSWTPLETATPRGRAVHLVAPAGAGPLRAAYHIHHFDKSKPGFLPLKEFLKKELAREKLSGREVTAPVAWRVGRTSGRVFEARGQRLFPDGRLPSRPVHVHHFYAFVGSGAEEYFMIKLSCAEEDFTEFRAEFRRFLATFRVVGY